VARYALGALTVCAALLLCSPATAAVREQNGIFAYHGVQQRVMAHLERTGSDKLDLVQISMETHKTVTNYVAVGGAPIHFFVIRDDFKTFTHLHPRVRGNGHFDVQTHLQENHRYYAYVDSFIAGIGEQTFRFTLQNGAPPHHLDVSLERPTRIAAAGPYRIMLSTARFTANEPMTLKATVMRGNDVVSPPKAKSFDAVAAVVDTGSLEYTSVYEGHANGLWYPGEYDRPELRLPPLPAGVYRMWLQLTIASKTYTAPFTLAVQ
jgi:hypothetical protein